MPVFTVFLGEACSLAEKLFTAIYVPPLMPDEDNNFGQEPLWLLLW